VETNKVSSVKHYISALRSKHVDKGLPVTVFADLGVARILNGAQRTYGAQLVWERLEITKDILLKMLSVVDTSTFNGLNIYASFCVAFAGFFGAGEITWDRWQPATSPLEHMSRKSVKFTSNGVILHLPKSKTDQSRKGINITLSFVNDASCPVRALQRLVGKYPRHQSSPLFDRVVGPFNKRWFSENISDTLLQAGMPNASKYSGHSFRRGAANSAISAGLSLEEVKILGRWQSDAAKVYLTEKSTDTIKFAINTRLHQ
jgi:hypothetical protein